MTNEEIIKAAKTLNGITEEAHTFARWKSLGFVVKKGEHAAFKATIWKHRTKKVEVDGEEQEQVRMFMKTASFFTASQVEALA